MCSTNKSPADDRRSSDGRATNEQYGQGLASGMLITPGPSCPGMGDGETVSVYFNKEEYEELVENGLDELDLANSAAIKEAIEVYLGARDAGKALLTDHRNDPGDLRRWVYAALIANERQASSDPTEVERRLAESRERDA